MRPGLLAAALFIACSASAAPQWLVAANAGVSLPGRGLLAGPEFGLWTSVSPWKQLGIELAVDSSIHRLFLKNETSLAVWRAAGSLGLQYRIDLGSAVPYAALRLEGQRFAVEKRSTVLALGGAAALGFWVPVATHFFAGAEVRYGFLFNSTAFPVGASFVATFGWRSADF
ncbi:MAG: hypothetical protein ACT4TC_14865 [Myxococcaceae bacterium]